MPQATATTPTTEYDQTTLIVATVLGIDPSEASTLSKQQKLDAMSKLQDVTETIEKDAEGDRIAAVDELKSLIGGWGIEKMISSFNYLLFPHGYAVRYTGISYAPTADAILAKFDSDQPNRVVKIDKDVLFVIACDTHLCDPQHPITHKRNEKGFSDARQTLRELVKLNQIYAVNNPKDGDKKKRGRKSHYKLFVATDTKQVKKTPTARTSD